MLPVQLKVWKTQVTNKLSSHRQLISLLPSPLPLPFTSTPHIIFLNFCSRTAPPSRTPPHRGLVTDFIINKCGLTEEEIVKAFRHRIKLLSAKSSRNLEEVWELLNGYGLTTPAQFRKVVLYNPILFFYDAKRNLQPKLTLLGTYMKGEDLCKLIYRDSKIFDFSEARIKSSILLIQKLGVEGEALSKLLGREPRFLSTSHERVMRSFKLAEDWGFNKGSKMFVAAVRAISGVSKENAEKKLQCLSSVGFSQKQVSELLKRWPFFLELSEERVMHQVDFLVKSVGIPLDNLVKNPTLIGLSLERRVIPRLRVMEALKSMPALKTELIGVSIFLMSEKRFLEKYVNKNVDSSILLDIYHHWKNYNEQGDAQ